MRRPCLLLIGVALAGGILAFAPCRAVDVIDYSPDQLNFMDDWGVFPVEFKGSMENLFETNKAIIQANEDEAKLKLKLPDYQKKAAAAQAKADEIRRELAEYQHTDETDFVELQKEMNDPNSKLEDLIKLAQEYVWAYSTSPHQAQAQQYLQQFQEKQANESQAEKDAEAARAAARAKLLERIKARDLSLEEWTNFLFNLSEVEVMSYIGPPDSTQDDYWLYTGDYTVSPKTQQKIGLRLNFNAGRVITVLALPHSSQ